MTTLARTVVLVADQDRALAFYRDALGFATLHDAEAGGLRYLHVGPAGGGAALWLMPADGDSGALAGRQAGDHPFLVLYVDDLDATRERLVARGAGIFNERDDADSRSLQFRDADGNVIVAAQLHR